MGPMSEAITVSLTALDPYTTAHALECAMKLSYKKKARKEGSKDDRYSESFPLVIDWGVFVRGRDVGMGEVAGVLGGGTLQCASTRVNRSLSEVGELLKGFG